MESFLQQHAEKITGVLSCFDRLIFKGYLPFSYPRGMEGFLHQQEVLLKDFRAFALDQSQKLKDHAQALAEAAGRPLIYLEKRIRKEDEARRLAAKDGVTEGLVCVFSKLETCSSFKIAYGKGRPRLKKSYPRCLVFYFYYLDPEFGLLHIRLPTWFPFTIQVYVNGHDWLAHQLDKRGIGYHQHDNAFLAIDNLAIAQALADQLTRKKWPRFLNVLARRVHPLLGGLLKGQTYDWVTDQCEFATDVLFKDRQALQSIYPRLLEHASLQFSAEDILSFLGKKLDGRFRSELTGDLKKRPQGYRVKHCYDGNWIKMYDKAGQVLRVEMVINRPRRFYVRRWGNKQGERVFGWFTLLKNVAYLGRYAEIARQATQRYLQALAVVTDPQVCQRMLDKVCNPVSTKQGRRRALNPLSREDQKLFLAVLRGEHIARGFYARDVAKHLQLKPSKDPKEKRRQSGRVGRLLQLLRAHGLINKLPKTRRYRVTDAGFALMSAAIHLRHKGFPEEMAA